MKERLAESPAEKWTRADDYVTALARKRTARKLGAPKPRNHPESPRLLLSTLPFLVVLGLLAILAVSIMIAAFPGNQPQQKVSQTAREQGVAAKGWLQEAQKDMHQ
ncbi:MAG TPA: hypothetical protein VFW39_08730 [Sphingomicrobium sp.]|nr:hypothetical protein [Sphingomicrobium sp.]